MGYRYPSPLMILSIPNQVVPRGLGSKTESEDPGRQYGWSLLDAGSRQLQPPGGDPGPCDVVDEIVRNPRILCYILFRLSDGIDLSDLQEGQRRY